MLSLRILHSNDHCDADSLLNAQQHNNRIYLFSFFSSERKKKPDKTKINAHSEAKNFTGYVNAHIFDTIVFIFWLN